jgi:hypothetical protein
MRNDFSTLGKSGISHKNMVKSMENINIKGNDYGFAAIVAHSKTGIKK